MALVSVFVVFNTEQVCVTTKQKLRMNLKSLVTTEEFDVLKQLHNPDFLASLDSLPSVFLPLVANEDGESSNRPQASFARKRNVHSILVMLHY